MSNALAVYVNRPWTAMVVLLIAGPAFTASTAPADSAPGRDGSSRPLVVAIADSPPFAIKNSDGTWSGLSVDLWREVAEALGLRWEPREVNLAQIDALLRDHTVDAALGAIAIDAEGAAAHDFSLPYYANGLGFAEHSSGELSWRTTLAALASSHLLRLMVLILAATLVVGVLITLIERRHNVKEFGGPWRHGIATGVWWAAVTMTTVGYGDTTPKTPTGRSLAFLWMFVGVVAVAIFTATVTSILTVGSLQGTVRHPSDLFQLRLGAVAGSAGADFLTRRHVRFTAFDEYEQALPALAEHHVDAVVANAPNLRYLVSRQWQGVLRVSPIVLEPLSYAIGLPTDSPLRESINRVLLRIVEQDRWRDVEQQYLGHP